MYQHPAKLYQNMCDRCCFCCLFFMFNIICMRSLTRNEARQHTPRTKFQADFFDNGESVKAKRYVYGEASTRSFQSHHSGRVCCPRYGESLLRNASQVRPKSLVLRDTSTTSYDTQTEAMQRIQIYQYVRKYKDHLHINIHTKWYLY